MNQTAYLTELWTDLNRISICICCDHIICKFWRIWHRNKVSKLSLIYQSTSEITSTPFEWTEKRRIDTMNLISMNLHLIQRQLAKRSCSKYVASEVKSLHQLSFLFAKFGTSYISLLYIRFFLFLQLLVICSERNHLEFRRTRYPHCFGMKISNLPFPFPSTYGDNGLTFLSLFP